MKKLLKVILSILLFSVLVYCSETSSPTVQQFSGITETSEIGPEPVGSVDSTDWLPRYDYFTGDSALGIYTISVQPAFPNPTNRFTTLRYTIPAMDSIKIWIEDSYGNQSIIKSEIMRAGGFDQRIDLLYDERGKERISGIYRIYFCVLTRPEVPLIKGDIELRK